MLRVETKHIPYKEIFLTWETPEWFCPGHSLTSSLHKKKTLVSIERNLRQCGSADLNRSSSGTSGRVGLLTEAPTPHCSLESHSGEEPLL